MYIVAVEYYKTGPIWDFSVDDFANYEHGGVIHANSGKTLVSAVEVARAVLGKDPHGKYPKAGELYIVGYDYDHHGITTFPKLFKPGAFKAIRDRRTGDIRAYRPWDADDVARKAEAVKAEPLIPWRYVEEISWYKKTAEQPDIIRLTTGWVIRFYSGEGLPPQGSTPDLVWIDEEIRVQTWYTEMSARVVDNNGKIIWSAAPQAGTDQLLELHEQAEATAGDPERIVEEYEFLLSDNPHLDEKAKRDLEASITDENERLVRIGGQFLSNRLKIYGEFSLAIHGVEWFPVPDHWTRYAVIDPGHQICAVLFAAVPPPHEAATPGEVYLYDELYIPKADAAKFAAGMAGKTAGHVFEAFLCDRHGAAASSAGTGKSVAAHYSEALAAQGVRSRLTGTGFLWGSDDETSGIESVRAYLRIGPSGRPKLRVMCERAATGGLVCKLPNFKYEIDRFKNKKIDDQVTDVPNRKGRCHLMDDLRYLCAFGPKYVTPARVERAASPAYLAVQRKQAGSGGVRVGRVIFGPDREVG